MYCDKHNMMTDKETCGLCDAVALRARTFHDVVTCRRALVCLIENKTISKGTRTVATSLFAKLMMITSDDDDLGDIL